MPVTFPGQRSPALGVVARDSPDGCQIARVLPGSAAAEAGLRTNDVLLLVAGKKVQGPPDLEKALLGARFGDPVLVEVRRGDRPLQIKVLLTE